MCGDVYIGARASHCERQCIVDHGAEASVCAAGIQPELYIIFFFLLKSNRRNAIGQDMNACSIFGLDKT